MKNSKWLRLPDNTRIELKYSTWKQILERTKRNCENWSDFSERVQIPRHTLQSYFYQRSKPSVGTLKKFIKNSNLDPKIIHNGIKWNKELRLLSMHQNSLENIIVNINEKPYINLASLIKGSKIYGYSLNEQFPFQGQILPNDKIRVWYKTGKSRFTPKTIESELFIPLNKEIFTCFGLLQAESCKVKGYLSLDFSNTLPFLHKFVLDYFERYWNINRKLWNCEVVYWKGKLSQKTQKKLESFWSKKLNIDPNKIKIREGTQYRLSAKASRYGAASLRLNNKTLRSLVISVLNRIIKPLAEQTYDFCGHYLKGLLAGDGYLSLDPSGSLAYVGIAFNPKSDEREHYFKLLDLIGVEINKKIIRKKNRRCIQITGWWNYLKILQATKNKPFFPDKKKNLKFYKGFLLGQYVKPLTRIEIFKKTENVTSKDYSKEFKVCQRNSIDCLNRLVRLGFLKKNMKNMPYVYNITKKGEKFLNTISTLKMVIRNE